MGMLPRREQGYEGHAGGCMVMVWAWADMRRVWELGGRRAAIGCACLHDVSRSITGRRELDRRAGG